MSKNWSDLPENLQKKIVSLLCYKSRCTLRKCSKTERALVDTTPLKLYRLIIVIHQVHVRLHIFQECDSPLFVHYWRFEMCCKQKLIHQNNLIEKIHRDGTWIGMAKTDLECLLTSGSSLDVSESLVLTCKDGYNWEQLCSVFETSHGRVRTPLVRFFGEIDHRDVLERHIDFENYKFERLTASTY